MNGELLTANKEGFMKITILSALILVLGMSQAWAWRGNPNVKGPYCTQERQQAVHKAIEDGNYEEWKTLMEQKSGRGRVLNVVNKENFGQFAKAYQLSKEGKFDEADEIRSQLGLPPVYRGDTLPEGMGRGRGRGMGMGRNW